ncbi:MAG TPA: helicase-related protein [Saprospiraceae bacterium]|nr:helicase-related protein [Saprospiraceae bacterium]
MNVLAYLLKKEEFKKTLIFTRTKALADQVFEKLNLLFPNQIGIIHSNKEQNYRFKSVEDFKQGITIALIATDIIARGIDIEGVSHVINFDIPDLPELYIHRIGRTGRADKDGIAISFITEKDEPLHDEIETFIQKAVSIVPLPEDIKISDILTDDELPNTGTREIQIKRPKIDLTSSAFHEKSDKNKKTNHKIRRNEKMMKKYGKPITRGQKKKKSS